MPTPQAYMAEVEADGTFLYPSAAAQADIDATASGNTQVVAAVSGNRIRVVSVLVTNKASTLRKVHFRSGATTEITATHAAAADGGGFARDAQPGGWLFQTAVGGALNVNLDASGDIGCDVTYRLIS